MGQVVIVAYQPKPGKEADLKELMKTHLPRLIQEGLVRDKESYIMETGNGTIIEVFEWLSADAIQKAHTNPIVQQMWKEYAEVCDYIPVGNLAEAVNMFASFEALN